MNNKKVNKSTIDISKYINRYFDRKPKAPNKPNKILSFKFISLFSYILKE